MLVYRIGCWYTGWVVSTRYVVLVYGMLGRSYTGWGVSLGDGVLVNGMIC